ncbi:MAG TPA: Rieske (2Fe-2S) protein [Micromonosporaceae bacterium]|nr:Rieske (2Fe-2S) protein [Micromonosporaceae bacterium]
MTEHDDSVSDRGGPTTGQHTVIDMDAPATERPTRRAVLIGAGAIGAAGLLAACGGDEPAQPEENRAPGATGADPTAPAEDPSEPDPPEEPPAGGDLAAADVPVGGGIVLSDRDTIVTQPTAGEFRAFSATCTHMQCQLTQIDGGRISCFCHGSQFSIADGSVMRGPASRPLSPRQVTVTGDTLTID